MPHEEQRSKQPSRLRHRAEEMLKLRPEVDTETDIDMLELIHELDVHQTELEIQNEELQRAQGQISALHREYEDLYEFAPCGYVTLNPQGVVTRCNLSGGTLLGAEKARLTGVGFSSFVAPEWRDDYWTVLKRAGESGERHSLELKLISADNGPLWVLADVQASRTGSGEVSQWRLVLADITERKRAEEDLGLYRDHLEELVRQRTAELTRGNEQLKHEIEERKKVEKALRETQRLLEEAQGIAGLGGWEYNVATGRARGPRRSIASTVLHLAPALIPAT
jgi:PAS domain S-box-containing protein